MIFNLKYMLSKMASHSQDLLYVFLHLLTEIVSSSDERDMVSIAIHIFLPWVSCELKNNFQLK